MKKTGWRASHDLPFIFASAEEGKELLTKRDDFVQRLSPFDRAARLKTDKNVSEKAYLEFVGNQALDWTDDDKAYVQSVLSDIRKRLKALSLPWPESISLIKTTGSEEGNAPYTRANAIILPTGSLAERNPESLRTVIAHELFHILTRRNPPLKEKLYAAIGFKLCNETVFPSNLKRLKITNPDAPKNDHCIRVTIENKEVWVTPVLFAKSKYDVSQGGDFFDYLEFKFLRADGTGAPVDVSNVSGFFEQIGKNTKYIIHPEEILADNFALLFLGNKDVPSPKIIRKMKDVLDKGKAKEPTIRR